MIRATGVDYSLFEAAGLLLSSLRRWVVNQRLTTPLQDNPDPPSQD